MNAKKSISKLAKQAVQGLKMNAAKLDKDIESEIAFEWCVQSAEQILNVMPDRMQKSFVRRVKDSAS